MNKSLILFLTYLSLFLTLSPNQELENKDWELAKIKDEISIYTRKVNYSGYKEFKSEMFVNASPEKVVRYLKNINEYRNWLPDCIESKRLEVISNAEQINYILTDVPWPYEDRDLAYKFTIVPMDSISEQLKILIENKPEIIPIRRRIVRIPRSNGFWIITPIEKNQAKLVYQMHVEPGGYVPAWLYNMKIVDTPYTFMYNLRIQVEKE